MFYTTWPLIYVLHGTPYYMSFRTLESDFLSTKTGVPRVSPLSTSILFHSHHYKFGLKLPTLNRRHLTTIHLSSVFCFNLPWTKSRFGPRSLPTVPSFEFRDFSPSILPIPSGRQCPSLLFKDDLYGPTRSQKLIGVVDDISKGWAPREYFHLSP